MEGGLSRTVPENHDTLAWLLQHAAATVNRHCTGVDGRTPFHRRAGEGCRQVVAPLGGSLWRWTGCERVRYCNTRWCGGGTGDQARARRECWGRGAVLECEATRVSVPRTPWPVGVSCANSISSRKMEGKARRSSRLATGVHRKERLNLGVRSNSGMSRLLCNRHRE